MTKKKLVWHHGNKPAEPPMDPTPIEVPTNASIPTPLHELIGRFVAEQSREEELETYEDADDFDMDTEAELLDMSPYTLNEVEPDAETVDSAEVPPDDPDPPKAEPDEDGAEPSD